MKFAALVVVLLALAAGMTGLGLAVRGDEIAATNSRELQSLVQSVKTLLLNGKSASAVLARRNGREVRLLFVQIEQHLDATVLRDVNDAATRVQHAFGH